MAIKNVAVVGGGTMGNGIAHVFAQNGYETVLIETKQEFLDRAISTIKKNLERQAKKGKITGEDISATMGRLKLSLDINDAKSADIVIEAVFEDPHTKGGIFEKLDSICRPQTIFASNTSSLPITAMAADTSRPDKFIGMHFMNPVPMMKLVEVIRGIATSDETFKIVKELSEAVGKTPVEVNDYPGFVSNRVLMPMINEAIYCVMEGVAKPEDIDTVMMLGMAHPMGPLTLADFIGLDVCLDIMNVLYEGYSDSKYRPCPLLKKMVHAGFLGRKSGRGFFVYDK
ncbi:MAG: 3-hydroxybutyryl-CoA dehydrogenase [Candidatus Zixiibacteriota bacterium]|nr:MAG: 3-hydroxybutyryl-CoA dehydrogenase [candidate division Zixibacteria bacterium]